MLYHGGGHHDDERRKGGDPAPGTVEGAGEPLGGRGEAALDGLGEHEQGQRGEAEDGRARVGLVEVRGCACGFFRGLKGGVDEPDGGIGLNAQAGVRRRRRPPPPPPPNARTHAPSHMNISMW